MISINEILENDLEVEPNEIKIEYNDGRESSTLEYMETFIDFDKCTVGVLQNLLKEYGYMEIEELNDVVQDYIDIALEKIQDELGVILTVKYWEYDENIKR